MNTQTLALLVVSFLASLVAATILALHGLAPASVALGIGQAGLTGAFALATPGRSLTLAPVLPPVKP